MAKKYFIKYKANQTAEPYQLPEKVRNDLNSIDGLNILYESNVEPKIVALIPDDKLDELNLLESILSIEDDFQENLF